MKIVLHWVVVLILSLVVLSESVFAVVNPQNGAIGLTGTIPSPPPSQGATIATPSNGQTFTTLPITVSGLCPTGLLVKLFINNVFSGSATCVNGSYSISTALFNGTNNLVVIDYDALDQAGPSSNTVTVYFNPPSGTQGITLTSPYAREGTNPGQLLTWPIEIYGGDSPYAISINWGDGTPSTLMSQAATGTFNITHTYNTAGIYTILIKATDINGDEGFLQLVAVVNGPTGQTTSKNGTSINGKNNSSTSTILSSTTLIIMMIAVLFLPISSFWLGKKHERQQIRRKIENDINIF